MRSVLVTGANGHLGRRLIAALPAAVRIEALVRTPHAREVLRRHVGERPGLNTTVADPGDEGCLAELAQRCDVAVHLIGTIRETRDNRYPDSHQRPARALAAAAAHGGLRHIIYVSILGADAASRCRCLQARAAVEAMLRDAPVPATILRVPMVLGEHDRASRALRRRAAARRVFLVRAGSLEQPLYAGDLVDALQHALEWPMPTDQVLELAGPESLSRRALVQRAAAVLNRHPRIHSLPFALGLLAAYVVERLRAAPPVTADMLCVLDHDDAIDPGPAAAALGIALTPLDEMLVRCLGHPSAAATLR